MSLLFSLVWLLLLVHGNCEEFILNVDDTTEVIGVLENNVEYFLGIQYATVGERFSKSLENSLVESASSMNDNSTSSFLDDKIKIDASSYGPDCYQLEESGKEFSEECLYLNIWRPQGTRREGALPVMVWIHGGGFVAGSGSKPLYNGAKLASERYVMLITINYRLGAFGFMAQDDTGRGGSNGLDDQINALKWIQHNIKTFGGDPDRVTIMGGSAGGVSVCLLCISPYAKGLFRRAIIQSGQCISGGTAPELPSEGFLRTETFLNGLGLSSVDEVSSSEMSPEALTRDAMFTFNKVCVDGEILQSHPLELYHGRAEINPEDVIIGSTTFDDPSALGSPTAAYISRAAGFESYVTEQYGFLGQDYVEKTLDAYPTYLYAGSEVARFTQFNGDSMFRCSSNELAPIIAGRKRGGGIYSYVFSQHTLNDPSNELIAEAEVPEIISDRWASHTTEIPFQFGNLEYTMSGEAVASPKDREIALSKEMMARWSNFADFGVPRTDYMGTEWTQVPWNLEASLYRASDTPYLEFKAGSSEMVESNPNKVDQCTAIPGNAIYRSTKVETGNPTSFPTSSPIDYTPSPTSLSWTLNPVVDTPSSSCPRSFLFAFSSYLFGFIISYLILH